METSDDAKIAIRAVAAKVWRQDNGDRADTWFAESGDERKGFWTFQEAEDWFWQKAK